MYLIGKKVTNSWIGSGVVISQDGDYIHVQFDKKPQPSRFKVPDCFRSALTLLDSKAREEMERILQEKDHQKPTPPPPGPTGGGTGFSSKGSDVETFSDVNSFVSHYQGAVTAEVMYLKTAGSKHITITDGVLVESGVEKYVYSFDTDEELNYPAGTVINIWKGSESYTGRVISCEDFVLLFSTSTYLGKEISSLEISADPWRLLNYLNSRLEEVKSKPSPIVRQLVCNGRGNIERYNRTITKGQNNAVAMSLNQPITFVWGPPGTGKTQTLARIAIAQMQAGKSVLMLSYSNVSVDGATLRVFDLMENARPGCVVRYGYPKNERILNHTFLSSYSLALYRHPELVREREALLKERKNTSPKVARYAQIQNRLRKIREALDEEEKLAVNRASFVSTTVSKAVADKTIYQRKFDVVIFDEASMAYIPQIVFSASLARSHFICMGDFRQLPPIVQSSSSNALNKDIFQYCGITDAVDSGYNHNWLCMLDTQYRMQPQIADFASHAMYNNLLRSADEMERSRQEIVDASPIRTYPLAFVDLSGMMSVCTKTQDQSRINVLSAFVTFALAWKAAQSHTVGVITPYHSQSRLLHAMARDAADAAPDGFPIACATVHQFQGSEKDVILYDAVDCYRMTHPGMLLTSNTNNYANRLFNVAVTRAKGKFIGVANMDYMDNKNITSKMMFGRLMSLQRKKPSCISCQKIVEECSLNEKSPLRFIANPQAFGEFLKDLAAAKKEIRIDIPDKPAANAHHTELANALNNAKKRGVAVYLRAESRKNLPMELTKFSVENPFVVNPVAMIDNRIVWFGMPDSDANFITEKKEVPTRFHPIIRFAGTHTAKALFGYLRMNDTDNKSTVAMADTFSDYVLANTKCPKCGKPMRLKKSKQGRFFLGCTGYPACTTPKPVDVDLINRYFFRHDPKGQRCPKCGLSLEGMDGPYGVYVQCGGIPHHRFKLDQI